MAKNAPAILGKAYDFMLRHKKAAALVIAFFILTLLFTSKIRIIISILLLAAAGAFGQVYRRSIRVPPAIEFVTFGTVLVGYSYGPWAGAIFGIVVTLAAEVMSSTIDAFVIGYVPSRAAIGVIASFLTAHGIVDVGIWMTIAYNVLAQPLYLLQPDAELRLKLVFFVTGNIIFNIMLFRLLAEPVLFLMG
jgi:hypothetical protein